MNRIPVDLSDDQHAALTTIAAIKNSSRAEIIRDAIDAYIARHRKSLPDEVFGLWKGRAVTSQEILRSEW
ncbi:ribbon-helix-helix protein, CopG family [Burkholderia pyrrocinia]|uniref:ribbon-helix-helix domain-containing protein n=1 Tax=Burkholderia pyrrocinia TaxID=60550 RepID=UPI0015755157|nr:CopG family transcriptional regulator [Burkholderia pyrrocinia]NTX28816.1 ribbon-helix-helix protein, CopG family [Burkholderia pyrrocinia]